MTIASGGVLPNIHPELLKKRKGGKLVAPDELKPKHPKTTSAPKPTTSGKKMASPVKKAVSPAKKAPISAGKAKKKGVSERVFYLYYYYYHYYLFNGEQITIGCEKSVLDMKV